MGPAAPWHVGSSQTRARTRVPCIGRQILNHCATREAQKLGFVIKMIRQSLKNSKLPIKFLMKCKYSVLVVCIKMIPLENWVCFMNIWLFSIIHLPTQLESCSHSNFFVTCRICLLGKFFLLRISVLRETCKSIGKTQYFTFHFNSASSLKFLPKQLKCSLPSPPQVRNAQCQCFNSSRSGLAKSMTVFPDLPYSWVGCVTTL